MLHARNSAFALGLLRIWGDLSINSEDNRKGLMHGRLGLRLSKRPVPPMFQLLEAIKGPWLPFRQQDGLNHSKKTATDPGYKLWA